jgi:hypothetical protein
MYFKDEPLNEEDRLFMSVEKSARSRLAVDFSEAGGVLQGDFPIVLAKVT